MDRGDGVLQGGRTGAQTAPGVAARVVVGRGCAAAMDLATGRFLGREGGGGVLGKELGAAGCWGGVGVGGPPGEVKGGTAAGERGVVAALPVALGVAVVEEGRWGSRDGR